MKNLNILDIDYHYIRQHAILGFHVYILSNM